MVLTRHGDSRKLPKPRAASESQNNSMLCARRNERDGVTASVTERLEHRGRLAPRTVAETAVVNARDGNGSIGDEMRAPQEVGAGNTARRGYGFRRGGTNTVRAADAADAGRSHGPECA